MHHNKAVEIRDLKYSYPDGTVALKGIDIDIEHGQSIALLGANGAGKSTFALHLNGSLKGDGRVMIFGLPIAKNNLMEIRRRVGLVFQDPDDQLFSSTVFDDVAFGPVNMGLSPNDVRKRVLAALSSVGMEGFEERPPYHLSFGQKKRVAIATALSMEPDMLVLDEPTSNLDPRGKGKIIEIIEGLPITKLIITHNLDEAKRLCERAVIMSGGKIVADGEASAILSDEPLLKKYELTYD
ncbi:MAG: ABC transporter ATP-binding protein [Actinomycetota bacterium]|nr:ABC transporter ATP-binding protein [Actinomycetota bacterium]